MKYYVYVSDTKVDMLLAQIPHDFKTKVATQFKIDLKVLVGSRTVERETEDNRFTRLETVCQFIREYGNVGTVDEPNEYISDELRMRWGPFGDGDPSNAPLVYFGGVTAKTIIGLGGSIDNVIGKPGPANPSAYPHSVPGSIGAILVHYLMKELGLACRNHVDEWEKQEEERLWPHYVRLTTLQMGGPIESLEFLAKRLLEERPWRDEKNIVLATPLYVAMTD